MYVKCQKENSLKIFKKVDDFGPKIYKPTTNLVTLLHLKKWQMGLSLAENDHSLHLMDQFFLTFNRISIQKGYEHFCNGMKQNYYSFLSFPTLCKLYRLTYFEFKRTYWVQIWLIETKNFGSIQSFFISLCVTQ